MFIAIIFLTDSHILPTNQYKYSMLYCVNSLVIDVVIKQRLEL